MTKHIISGMIAIGGSTASDFTTNTLPTKLPAVDTTYTLEFRKLTATSPEPDIMLNIPGPDPNDLQHNHAAISTIKAVFAVSITNNAGKIYLDIPSARIGSNNPSRTTKDSDGDYNTPTLPAGDWPGLFEKLFFGGLNVANGVTPPFQEFSRLTNKGTVVGQIDVMLKLTEPQPPSLARPDISLMVTIPGRAKLNFDSTGRPPSELDPFPAKLDPRWGDNAFPLSLRSEGQIAPNFYAEYEHD